MSQMESALYNLLRANGGGITIKGETIVPTLIAGQCKQAGNTQDGLIVIALEETDKNEEDIRCEG